MQGPDQDDVLEIVDIDARVRGRRRRNRGEVFPRIPVPFGPLLLAQLGSEGLAPKAHLTTTLTIWWCPGEGRWKACLNHRSGSCSLFKAGSTIEEALDALELALGQEVAGWRPTRPRD